MRRLILMLAVGTLLCGQQPATPNRPPGREAPTGRQYHVKRQVLVFAGAKGFHHDSIPNAIGTVWKLGKESGMWETEIYTDTSPIRKPANDRAGGGFAPLNLYNFDAIVFASSTGEMDLDDQQKKDLLSAIHDDGVGFVGIHAAMDAN